MLFRDFRGYQELMFGACVRNVMLFATFPYYVTRKDGRLGSQGLRRFGNRVSAIERYGAWSKAQP